MCSLMLHLINCIPYQFILHIFVDDCNDVSICMTWLSVRLTEFCKKMVASVK